MKPSQDCPADFKIETLEGSEITLKNYDFINVDDYKNIPEENLSKLTPKDVSSTVGAHLVSLLKEELPKTVYWTYGDENLLPGQISLAQFAANPSMCLPLKHMFELAQIVNIPDEIREAKEGSIHDLRNLLNRVAKITIDNFHKTWKEYNNIKFELLPDGDFIDISVKDKFNHYELSKRSDGFKRFITFLLMISARVKTGMLQDAIIIIDEPDTSLHPSGAKYLRDELFKISENNIVVFSTHSIFMIDKDNLEKHYIVKKENEKTSVSIAHESNIADEEVIYNALGCSVFENIKQKNILFEGWRDKKLFKVAMERVPKKYNHLKKAFDSLGMCHAKGAKDFRNITPLMEMVSRDCLILSDDDKPAKENQQKYIKDKGYGVWKRYSEIQEDVEAVTGEDFVKSKAFTKSISALRKEVTSLSELTENDLNDSRGKIYALQVWLRKGEIERERQKEIIENIKEEIFNNLKSQQIEESYYEFLTKLAEYISEMKSVAP